MIPEEFIEKEVRFYYSSTAFFGSTFKFVISRNKVYFIKDESRLFIDNWIKVPVEEKRLQRFLDKLSRLAGCQDNYQPEFVCDGMCYELICQTPKISKVISGMVWFEPEVALCLKRIRRLHPAVGRTVTECSLNLPDYPVECTWCDYRGTLKAWDYSPKGCPKCRKGLLAWEIE